MVHLEITTPEKVLISEDVDSVEAPGVTGEFQILAEHTPFLSGLKIGQVVFSVSGQRNSIAITGGFCEVKDNRAVILAHTAEKSSEIDKERAEEAKKRAKKRLESKDDPSIDEERARLALLRALNRLEASRM